MTTRIIFDDPMLDDLEVSEESAILIIEEYRAAVVTTSKSLKVVAVMATVAQRLIAGDSDFAEYFDNIAERLVEEGVMSKSMMH